MLIDRDAVGRRLRSSKDYVCHTRDDLIYHVVQPLSEILTRFKAKHVITVEHDDKNNRYWAFFSLGNGDEIVVMILSNPFHVSAPVGIWVEWYFEDLGETLQWADACVGFKSANDMFEDLAQDAFMSRRLNPGLKKTHG